jgi:pimeloyl-ACP methyl ester carboxylesterase
MSMTILVVLIVAAVLILMALLRLGLIFATQIMQPRMETVERTYQVEVENGRLNEKAFRALPKQEVHIRSPFQYTLFGLLFPVRGAKRIVLISHGFRYGLYGSVKFIPLFRQRGYSVLLFDLRHHGRSGGSTVTFGYKEKYDLKAWVDWAFQLVGADGTVGTMGESLGASVALQHAALDHRIAFTVADCPFSDLRELLKLQLKNRYRLPSFPLLNIAELWCWVMAGMTFAKASPIRIIGQVTTPVFLAHGALDQEIPVQMNRDLFAKKEAGICKLFIAKNAGHAEAYWKNRREYDRRLGSFLALIKSI